MGGLENSENKKIVELLRGITGQEVSGGNLKDAIVFISALLHEGYIHSLKREINDIRDHCHRHPSRELRLIKSMKPFIREERHSHMDRTIEAMNKVDAARCIHRDVRDSRGDCNDHNRGHHHHKDVYEIDVRCKRKKDIGKWVLGGAALWWLCRR